MNLFDKSTYSEIKEKAFDAYVDSIEDFLDYYQNFQSIQELLNLITENKERLLEETNYSKGLYFLSEAYKLASYIEPLIDFENEEADREDVETFLFDELTNTQYGQMFIELKDNGEEILDAANQTIDYINGQLTAFFYLHILKLPRINFPHYKDIFELADRYSVNSLKHFKISDIDFDLYVFTDDFSKQSKRISAATNIIKKYSPESYERLETFTKYITVLDDEGLVSYSSQYLPGYSSINLYHRDDLDLVDDLLHENGHHHMNHYLNHLELINEDDDQIYYSPWRKALRPVRGIYHAVWTFYFAFKIYRDLLNSEFYEESLNKEKIVRRFIEERDMLLFCKTDLEHAYENEKVTEEGKEFIDQIFDFIESEKNDISEEQLKLVENNIELKELSDRLAEHKKNKAY